MRTGDTRLPLFISILLAAASSAGADDRLDLARDTPVPSTEQIPLVDFFRPAVLRGPQLNPSGTHIAALVTDGDKHLLMVYDMKTQKKEFVSGGSGDKDIDGFSWLNDQRLVFEISALKLYGLGFFAADVGSLRNSYPLLQYYGSRLVSIPPKDRLHPLVWNRTDSFHDNNNDLGVAVINSANLGGKAINLAAAGADVDGMMAARDNNVRHIDARFPVPGPGIGTGYMADKDGQLGFGFTSENGRPAMFRLVSGHWEKCPVDMEHTAVFGAGNEPGQVVATPPHKVGTPKPLQFLDAATGKFGDVLEPEKAYDFTGWLYRDPITQDVIGAFSDHEGPHVVWFTDLYSNLQKILNGFFPGLYVQILGSNEAQNTFLVVTYSDRQPAVYNWVDLEAKRVGLFKKALPWIDPKRMQPEAIMKYKTRDGHQLDAYLTLPAGASKANPPPLVVIPHGGPWVRDNWGYNGEAQFLASRGYAVLKPNYRGSPGYDWMFPEEDEWDFRKMHDDVTDATKTMIASGLIDPHRVAIMGGSFGGYLAISGVVNEPALYRCAVTISGVFDWEQLINDKKRDFEHIANDPEFNRLVLKLGNPREQPEKFDSISPVRHVDRIRVPVFVSHGGYDPIADIGQSTRLISELEKNHVPHESIIKSEETHGMAHLDNQVELYSRIEAFLAKNLEPAPAAPPAGGAP